ncbi:MAG TPA: CBS domain-containing protein [Stellaceae bacterium]|nr:CBS domain-containing protein [Stellaceae bacterium]
MTQDVQTIAPDDTIQTAARLMDDLNVGILPVHDGTRVVGVITDRDITVRATSLGLTPTEHAVSDFMTDEVYYCMEEDSIEIVADNMAHIQIRRMPVLDRDNRLVGIISLGDIATHASQYRTTAEALRKISEPSQPDRAPSGTAGLRHGSAAPRRS